MDQAAHLAKNANLWRISGDFWDDWSSLKEQFALCRVWAPYVVPEHWPDADMLPLGRLRIRGYKDPERRTRFTPAEQRTHLTLWAIFRSPLMMGGDLPTLDAATLELLTNAEVIVVDQDSSRTASCSHAGIRWHGLPMFQARPISTWQFSIWTIGRPRK